MKIGIFLLTCFISCYVQAQVTIREKAVATAVQRSVQYDSLTNFIWKNKAIDYKQYIGYKLFYIPGSSKYEIGKNGNDTIIEYFYTSQPVRVMKPGVPYEKTTMFQAIFGQSTLEEINANANLKRAYDERRQKYDEGQLMSTKIYKPILLPVAQRFDDIVCRAITLSKAVVGKYFTILDIKIKNRSIDDYYSSLEEFQGDDSRTAQLEVKLKNDDTNDTLYWGVRGDFLNPKDYFVPYFLFVPYYMKQKEVYENQTLVALKSSQEMIDLNTGEAVVIIPNQRWKCSEVSLLEKSSFYHMQPSYVLKNENGNEICIDLGQLEDKGFVLEKIYLEQERQKKMAEAVKLAEQKKKQAVREQQRQQFKQTCIQKYGPENGAFIFEGKVKLGMGQDMCRMSWGEPLYVNRTVVAGLVHEQWVYCGNNYLYFDNGKLTVIQN